MAHFDRHFWTHALLKCVIAAGLFLALTGSPRAEEAQKPSPSQPSSPESIEFFEKEIRPLLTQHCQECHGAKKQESSLRLDSAAGVVRGSESGPVVVPGKPDESKLILAIRHSGELKMPEKKKLPDEAIAALTKWVELGIPWPEEKGSTLPSPPSPEAAAKTHWAFQPFSAQTPPAVKNESWATSPIDRFILAELEKRQLAPAADAERRTWLRRVSFDLIGLPPSPEEIDAFVGGESSSAHERVVDRLLASPHFGERWGRYWLDVARYADTKGYVFMEERRFPYAYVYRDWVVRAFNDDLPYDQFVLRQLAADLLPRGPDQRDIAALGYLTLGRQFLKNRPDILDDRIDVISRGLLGLTAGCARCHDHKFDPISMQDYYALYGVLSPSVDKQIPIESPSEKYVAELKSREQTREQFLANKIQELKQNLRSNAAAYLTAAGMASGPNTENFDLVPTANDLRPAVVERWKKFLKQETKERRAIFAPLLEYSKLTTDAFATQGAEIARRAAENETWSPRLNSHVAAMFQGDPPTSLREVADRYARLFLAADQELNQARQAAPEKGATKDKDKNSEGETASSSADWRQVWDVFHAEGTPTKITPADGEKLLAKPVQDELAKLRQKITDWQAGSEAPRQAHVLEDGPVGGNPRVFLRGNPNNLGPEVPRQFYAVLSCKERAPFSQGSGRLEFARAAADRGNPLTARIWINRAWLHLFGKGLVRTPSDFGLRTEPPSHPELLDDLAFRFVENGWSTKKLIREIVLSRTYRQSSMRPADDPIGRRAAEIDPENALLSRFNRRRLDLEGMRDGLLFASGKLDPALGGRSVEITKPPFSNRRTIYGNIERQNLPGLFRTFDFAGPDTHNPQRFTTTVPQQALYLMNSPFVFDLSKSFAARKEVASAPNGADKIQRLYACCYGRPATEEEVRLALAFLEESERSDKNEKIPPLVRLSQALLLSNEFAFLD